MPHYDLAAYVQRYAKHFGVDAVTSYNTRVEKVHKLPSGSWKVEARSLEPIESGKVKEKYWSEVGSISSNNGNCNFTHFLDVSRSSMLS